MVSEERPSGVFALDPRPAKSTVAELMERKDFLKPLLWGKIAEAPMGQHDGELHRLTHAEYEEKGWLERPRDWPELEAVFEGRWLPVQRFAVVQRGKIRPIDDLAENSVNDAFAPCDELSLRALDEVVWTASVIMRAGADFEGRVLPQTVVRRGAFGALARILAFLCMYACVVRQGLVSLMFVGPSARSCNDLQKHVQISGFLYFAAGRVWANKAIPGAPSSPK